MRKVTKLMINEFKLNELGYDFMGYHLNKGDHYTFHHLLIPNRSKGPYARWNGAILCGESSHPYLHIIEAKDYDTFCALTSEMFDMNLKGCLDTENIRHIDSLLCYFEQQHAKDRQRNGKLLIKEEYLRRVKL